MTHEDSPQQTGRTELPTDDYQGPCPVTGNTINTEKPCPVGWEITDLSVYSITYRRKSDGITAYHSVDEQSTQNNRDDELTVENKQIASGAISGKDIINHLSKIPLPYKPTEIETVE